MTCRPGRGRTVSRVPHIWPHSSEGSGLSHSLLLDSSINLIFPSFHHCHEAVQAATDRDAVLPVTSQSTTEMISLLLEGQIVFKTGRNSWTILFSFQQPCLLRAGLDLPCVSLSVSELLSSFYNFIHFFWTQQNRKVCPQPEKLSFIFSLINNSNSRFSLTGNWVECRSGSINASRPSRDAEDESVGCLVNRSGGGPTRVKLLQAPVKSL